MSGSGLEGPSTGTSMICRPRRRGSQGGAWKIARELAGPERIADCFDCMRVGFKRIGDELHLANIAFFRICERQHGGVFAVGPAGLFFVDGGRLHPYSKTNEPGEVYRVTVGPDDSLWLGTSLPV